MKKTYRILAILLALLLTFGLAACGSKSSSNSTTANESTATDEAAVEDAATDEAATDETSSNEDAASGETETSSASQTDATCETETANVDADIFTDRDYRTTYEDYETIELTGTSATTTATSGVTIEESTIKITEAGTYLFSGTLENGQIVVDVDGTDDKVQIVLDNANISNKSNASIYVLSADKVFVTTAANSTNTIANTGAFVQTDENSVDGAIYSKDDLVLNGEGILNITSTDHGIVGNDDLKITSGTINLNTTSKAIKANEMIAIADGTINVESATEGIEATIIKIFDGAIDINATDDGINASQKSTELSPVIEIYGGEITIDMAQGDTDALDSNGTLYIYGGTINLNCQSPFDYDGSGAIEGGTVYVNGQQVTEIYNQMMGGGMMGGFGGPGGQGNQGGGHGGWGRP